jgi:hypothetical protein
MCLSVTALFFAGVSPAFGVGHNATHAFSFVTPGTAPSSGSLPDPEPEIVSGNSIYTLTNGSAHSGKVLDEVYLTLTFKSGETPSLSRVVNVSYGSGVSIPGTKFFATISAQNSQQLCLWYGFQDLAQETNPNYNAFWALSVIGSSPHAKVETYIAFHSGAATDMPDLYDAAGALRQDRLKTVSLNDLVNEWSNEPMPGDELKTTDSKVIVLVHGWNPMQARIPGTNLNHYAPIPPELKHYLWTDGDIEDYDYDPVAEFAWSDPSSLSDLRRDRLLMAKSPPKRTEKSTEAVSCPGFSSHNGSPDWFRASAEGTILLLAAWRARSPIGC